MDASEYGKLARQGLDTHLNFVKLRAEILALLDRIGLVLREEFKIPDLELRFKPDRGLSTSDEGLLVLTCMAGKTRKDRRQLSLQVAEFVLPSEQGEKGRLGDFDFVALGDFQQLLADEMKRPRFGALMKKIVDSDQFDPSSGAKLPVSDSIGNRGFIPPPPPEDPDDDSL